MNHNKHNLKVGDKVILDETYANSSHVYIDSFTPMSMYATVHDAGSDPDDPESYWQVMTARLTPIFVSTDQPEEEQASLGFFSAYPGFVGFGDEKGVFEQQPNEGTTEGASEGANDEILNVPLPTGKLYYFQPKVGKDDKGKAFHSENYKPQS